MTEYAQARVRVHNLTTFTVINYIERVGTTSLIEMESTMQIIKFCLYDLNVQNKQMSGECNSSICFFSLRASNLGRLERYCC